MQLAFYFDQTRCVGCNTCTVACKDWNGVNSGPVSWRRVDTVEKGEKYPEIRVYHASYSCNHCADPACVKACPISAISKRKEDGIVLIDRTKCESIGNCIGACPFNAIDMADKSQEPMRKKEWKTDHPAQKCTFCVDRLADGKKPACVDSCSQRALDCGPVEELLKKYPDAVFAYQTGVNAFPAEGNSLMPSYLVRKRK